MVAEGMTLGEKNGIKRDWVVQFVRRMFPGFLAEGMRPAYGLEDFQMFFNLHVLPATVLSYNMLRKVS